MHTQVHNARKYMLKVNTFILKYFMPYVKLKISEFISWYMYEILA